MSKDIVITDCKYIRIRDSNDYALDVEKFIKSVESQYKVDFRSLPHWQDLIQRLHVMTTDCKRKIQESNQRKLQIIDQIYVQGTRISPFDLTDNLIRTAKKWNRLKFNRNKRKVSLKPEPDDVVSSSAEVIENEENSAVSDISIAHPNTEIITSVGIPQSQLKSDFETETLPSAIKSQFLPANICINQHKIISPLLTRDSVLSFTTIQSAELEDVSEEKKNEWELLRQTSLVKCCPERIIIEKYSIKEQYVKFTMINCTKQYIHIRFKCITETTPFKKGIILPVTPLKLYPGIAVTFKFIFRLSSKEEFTSNLFFRTGANSLANTPAEAFSIPIESRFIKSRHLLVPDTISIPPVYSWQVHNSLEYKAGYVNISVDDDYYYHLHISKRIVNIVNYDSSNSMISVDVVSPNTESLDQRTEDQEVNLQSKSFNTSVGDRQDNEKVSHNLIDAMALIVDEVIDLALEVFVFKDTYLYLHPHSTQNITVYFTKAEYIGDHQSYYDFNFYDLETEELILTKTVQVLAEVLPHPIQIQPLLLDMSHSPIIYGFCTDHFTVTNTHKVYPVTVKIKLTTKMKKILQVHPLKILVSPKMSMNFKVKFCSREFILGKGFDDLVHFTIKIIIIGHKHVYNNVPPFFYEIIAPCALEFKEIYNDKYYKDLLNESQEEFFT